MKKTNSKNFSQKSAGQISQRVARVEKQVQSVVSTYIIQNLQQELPGFVTVGRVQVPADLRQARVYVSLLATPQDQTDSKKHEEMTSAMLKILQRHAAEIQDSISEHVQMKYLPKLQFFEDKTTEKILKIENILSDIRSHEDDLESSEGE